MKNSVTTRESKKRDILLHFDDVENEIVCYTVDSASFGRVREREFDGARISTGWLQEKPADEAERIIGELVFTLFDNYSSKKIGIRDYKEKIEIARLEHILQLEQHVSEGDAEAHFSLSMELHRRAISEKSLALLEESDRLLNRSAELGFEGAREYLADVWPQWKEVMLKRISRGKST